MEPQHGKPIFKLLIILLIIIFLSAGGYLLVNSLQKKSGNQIEISSEIPNFSVKIENEPSLLSILKSWNVFTDNAATYLTLNGKQTNKIKTIKITLSDTIQKLDQLMNSNEIVCSFNTIEYKDGLEIVIYLNKNYLLSFTDKKERDYKIQSLILGQLYVIFNTQKIDDDRIKASEDLQSFLKQIKIQPLILKSNL